MNLELVQLKPLEVEGFQLKEVLRCVLHSVFFQRALGPTRPREVDCDVLDIPYMRVDDPRVERGVEESVARFTAVLQRAGADHGRVCLSFYSPTVKKGWFSSREEKVFWERWILPVHVVPTSGSRPSDERQRVHEARRAALRACLMHIIRVSNEKRAHLPPLPRSTSAAVYEFEISFSAGDSTDESWGIGSTMRRMLQQGPPQLLNQ